MYFVKKEDLCWVYSRIVFGYRVRFFFYSVGFILVIV